MWITCTSYYPFYTIYCTFYYPPWLHHIITRTFIILTTLVYHPCMPKHGRHYSRNKTYQQSGFEITWLNFSHFLYIRVPSPFTFFAHAPRLLLLEDECGREGPADQARASTADGKSSKRASVSKTAKDGGKPPSGRWVFQEIGKGNCTEWNFNVEC